MFKRLTALEKNKEKGTSDAAQDADAVRYWVSSIRLIFAGRSYVGQREAPDRLQLRHEERSNE